MNSPLDNPVLIFAAVSVFPAALWVVTLIGWMITDDVGVFEGIFSVGLVIGLVLLAMRTSDPMISLAACASLIIGGVLYPVVRYALEARAHLQLDIQLMRTSYRLLDEKPQNIGAKVQLAKMCYKRRLYGSAIALLSEAVASSPVAMEDEKRTLNAWQAMYGRTSVAGGVRCPKCSAANKASDRYCGRCGNAVLISLAGGSWTVGGTPLKAFWLWALSVAVLVVAPSLATVLPPGAAVAAVSLVLGMSGVLFYRILRTAQA